MKASLRMPGVLTTTFALTVIVAGCSTASDPNAPVVQDCGIVAISSPPKYACGAKVYTAFQLAKMRADNAQKYQSGK